MEKSKVYFTSKINAESLVEIYKALGKDLNNSVGVKISTGEPGGHNYLKPELIKNLVNLVNGTIIECCTAYGGRRQDPAMHWEAIKEHGFLDIAPCDIMDEYGEMELAVKNGFHLKKNIVGSSLEKYKQLICLSHFKGHAMGGFGGALKNMSIGIASSHGKAYIHTASLTTDPGKLWDNLPQQDDFLESMADATSSVIDYIGKDNIVYINVANNLSVDCDCDSNPEEPKMADIGIFASLDPVALDKACYDAVVNSTDSGKASLIERMNSRHATHIITASKKLGIGNDEYEIINIDDK